MYLVCIMYISIPVATIFGTVWISPYCMDIIFPHPGSVLLPPEFLSVLFKRHL